MERPDRKRLQGCREGTCVREGYAQVGYSVFIDEGGRFRWRASPPGSAWIDWPECGVSILWSRVGGPAEGAEALPKAEQEHEQTKPPSLEARVARPDVSGEKVLVFRGDDASYLRWLSDNPRGYVVNAERNPKPSYLKGVST